MDALRSALEAMLGWRVLPEAARSGEDICASAGELSSADLALAWTQTQLMWSAPPPCARRNG